jgi:AraC family transcriptional regulator, transcriptional activator of pobA
VSAADLSLDRLADRVGAGAALQVVTFDGTRIGDEAEPVREPHRHDYHELLWVRAGSGEHRLDGEPHAVRPGTVTLIGRGQVHVFERASGLHGAVVRFGDELLTGGTEWLLAGRGGLTVEVPAGSVPALEATIAALAAEARRPADERTPALTHHLLAVLLLWVERWYDDARIERPDAADADLHRRFARLLEQDFARHHDAAHYADALAVPPAALSRALAEATGRTTKDLVLDRVMLEAARLLRYTERTVGEVAHATGYADPLYFSRAFKRRLGVSPAAYRDRVRGRTTV